MATPAEAPATPQALPISGIAVVGPIPPPSGGVAVFTQQLLAALRDRCAVAWVYGDAVPAVAPYVAVNARAVAVARRAMAARGLQVVVDSSHFVVEYPTVLSLLVPAVLRLRRVAWVKLLHDGTLPERYRSFAAWQRFVVRLALHAADRVVAVSQELCDWAQSVQPAATVAFISPLLPLGTEPEVVPEPVAQFMRGGDASVVAVGAFLPTYGFDQVATAVESLRTTLSRDLRVLLVTSGFRRDDAYRDRVVNGRDWLHVVEDLPRGQVLGILRHASVVVRATERESYGLARAEALWMGRPLVATDAGETRGAHLFAFGDSDSLQRALRRALETGGDDRAATKLGDEADDNLARLLGLIGDAAA